MPMCFKCGKVLATDQSLQYHLKKRVPCNTLYCMKCNQQFPNKILYDNHLHECAGKWTSKTTEQDKRHKVYDLIKAKDIFLIEVDQDTKKVVYISSHITEIEIEIKDTILMSFPKQVKYADNLVCNVSAEKVEDTTLWLLTNKIVA